jgi:hypothetical protein
MAINIDGNGLITLGGTASTQGRVRLSEDTGQRNETILN